MYLHLGGDICVPTKDIVAVMDMETSSTSKITREFFKHIQKNSEVVSVNEDLPKSYVIVNKNGVTTVYISPISSQTLVKRANNIKAYFSMQFK